MIDAKMVDEAVSAYVDPEATRYPDGSIGPWDRGWEAVADRLRFSSEPVELPGLGTATLVDYGQGHDGDCFIVFNVGDKLFRKEGFYSSYDGGEWDGFLSEVKPRDTIVTNYEKV